MTVRRTSAYSLRVPTTNPHAVVRDLIAVYRDSMGGTVTDSQVRTNDGPPYAGLGFRAPDDTTALTVAAEVLTRAGLGQSGVVLVTGYGIHRREVTA